MDSRQLKYFIAVAEERNISRAAERLHLSQPPLTRHIQALEDEMGVLLFKRTSWGVELTGAGEALLVHARNIRDHLTLAFEHTRSQAQGKTERVDVGAFGAVLLTYIPSLLDAFKRRHPDVETDLHNLPKDQMIEALRQGRLLAFFDRTDPGLPDLQSERVLQEPVLVAMHASNPLASASTVDFVELRDEPMIGNVSARDTKTLLQVLARHYGFEPHVAQRSNNLISAVSMVAAGFGSALVPQSLRILTLPNVVYRPLTADTEVSMDVHCIYRSGPSSLLRDFLTVVRSTGNSGN
jgi:DNA-binding transcriptional LysR family regulator